jgi:hypothetical protein
LPFLGSSVGQTIAKRGLSRLANMFDDPGAPGRFRTTDDASDRLSYF